MRSRPAPGTLSSSQLCKSTRHAGACGCVWYNNARWAAVERSLSMRMCRLTFSDTTMASSNTKPAASASASANAIRDRVAQEMHHGEAPRAGPWRRAGRCVRSTGSRVRGGHRIDIHPRKAPSGRRSYERSIVDGKTQGARARLATAARREEPGVRAREAARKLCTSETELLASACGTSAVRFDANFGAGPSALGARSAHRRGGTSAHAMIELTGGINALRGFWLSAGLSRGPGAGTARGAADPETRAARWAARRRSCASPASS